MNEVLNCIKERRGVMKFTDKVVEKEVLDQILDAGLYTPSGMNTQATVFVAISNPEVVAKLSAANASVMGMNIDPFYGAKQVIVVLNDMDAARTPAYDGPAAIQTLMLAAKSLGVGTRWIHRAKEVFEMDEWKAWLKEQGLNGNYEGVGNIILGYAAEEKEAPERKAGRIVYVD